jgi:hypothetical protein
MSITFTGRCAIALVLSCLAIPASLAESPCRNWNGVASCPATNSAGKQEPACKPPLPANTQDGDAIKWQIGFDYDTDGCLPSAGISNNAKATVGLRPTGAVNGQCAFRNQLDYANTYYRALCVQWQKTPGKTYCARMYAQYFLKDQSSPGAGHRNDWEFGLVWTTDDVWTHASYSAHGKVHTSAKEDLYYNRDTVYMVYHKDGGSTHAMRFATAKDELPENPQCQWVTPNLVTWDLMTGTNATNAQLQKTLNTADYGKAIVPMKNSQFVGNITKSIPPGYPPANVWQKAFQTGTAGAGQAD